MQQGELEKAEAALKEALAQKIDRPSFLLKLGECYIEMKRYGEAETVLREALAAKPDLATAHYNLAIDQAHRAVGEVLA
jgi:uncharacterized protein HemY